MTNFDALLKKTATVTKQTKNVVDEWQGDIPDAAHAWVEMAHSNPDQRVLIPCTNPELAKQLHSVIRAAHRAKGDTNLEVHGRPVYDKDKQMTHFGFSVGAKRAAKGATAAS